jgi:hypothetical protein
MIHHLLLLGGPHYMGHILGYNTVIAILTHGLTRYITYIKQNKQK